MPIFIYSAAKQDGEMVKGEREAENDKSLARTLRAEGLFLLKAEAEKNMLSAGGYFSELQRILQAVKPVGLVEKMFFTRNLGVMVEAGLSVTRAFEALIQQTQNPKFKKVLEDANNAITKGVSLAEALRINQKVFGTLYVNMIEVGEMTGKLTLVLKLLAHQMKKDNTLKKRVRGAMMYPAIIILALAIIGGLMMTYVVPNLTKTIKELGAPIPFTTQLVIGVSDFIAAHSLLILFGILGAIAGFWRILKTDRGKTAFDTLVLKLPVFGPLVKKFNSARFSRTLSYLITSGMPIVRSLEIVSRVLGNVHYRRAVEEAAREIQKGKQLHETLGRHSEIFQPVVIQMIKVGEEAGKVSELLLRVALFFEEEVNDLTKNLSTIIEPLLMIMIGLIVGLFSFSMLQPIYSSLGNL